MVYSGLSAMVRTGAVLKEMIDGSSAGTSGGIGIPEGCSGLVGSGAGGTEGGSVGVLPEDSEEPVVSPWPDGVFTSCAGGTSGSGAGGTSGTGSFSGSGNTPVGTAWARAPDE